MASGHGPLQKGTLRVHHTSAAPSLVPQLLPRWHKTTPVRRNGRSPPVNIATIRPSNGMALARRRSSSNARSLTIPRAAVLSNAAASFPNPALPTIAVALLMITVLKRIVGRPRLSSTPAGAFSTDSGQAAAAREELFGKISPIYDFLNDLLSLGLHRLWKRKAVEMTGLGEGEQALDVCCGSGDLTRLLASKVGHQGKAVGLDFARPMLQYAAAKTSKIQSNGAKKGAAEITWLKGDAMKLPFGDGQFDGVTVGYGLRNVASPAECLKELSRVVKPGRKVVVLDFNNAQSRFVRAFQFFCLQNIVVPVATLLGAREEYTYLKPSIERYPKGGELVSMALQNGFKSAEFIPIAGGLMGMLVATAV
eukprot:jgi/Bigna1/72478/fgenesh1_pg.20_\